MERTIVKTEGDFRAVIIRDEYPEAPDFDGQAGIIRLDYTGNYQADAKNEAAGDFEYAARHCLNYWGMRKGTEVFKRFLRVFHGARDIREFSYSYSPDSAVYVAFDTADMRAEWGCSEDATDGAEGTAAEWQAYIDGDVYGVAVERRVTVSSVTTFQGEEVATDEAEEWEEIDGSDVWGHYGEAWAKEAAVIQMNYYTPKTEG